MGKDGSRVPGGVLASEAAAGPAITSTAPRPFALQLSILGTGERLRAEWSFGDTHHPATVQGLADRWLRTVREMTTHALKTPGAVHAVR